MMSKSVVKCLSHLQNCGFIKLNERKDLIKEFSTLGLLVRRNLKLSLNKYFRTLNNIPIFPVSCMNNLKSLKGTIIPHETKSYGVLFPTKEPVFTQMDESIPDGLSLWEERSPILNLVIVSEAIHSSNLFNSFQNRTYRWWRTLSPSPSLFYQSAIEKPTTLNEDRMFIAFRSPLLDSQSICVERMSHIYDREQIDKLTKTDNDQNLICCSIFQDNATLAYLINGLSTSTSHQNQDMFFQNSLAPYKVAIFIDDSSDSDDFRAHDIANYLMKNLGESGIDVFPFICHHKHHLMSLGMCDKIGIPYIVSIKQESKDSGVIYLRNKETKLEEQVYISQIKMTLLLYLKMITPLDVKMSIFEERQKKEKTSSKQ
ncbi:DNA polymerase subunit gamma-2, mitochondrial [Brevipalpus obovatus]|uniref:DNA polymerase subunit gamma-2, mitochondrial n=1 Tax=Brevipalpus obovatus TaxID=246614 RepID=UPI003D9FA3EC